jgi:hypothetical protein
MRRSGERDRHEDLGSFSCIGSQGEERLVRRGVAVLGAVLGVFLIVRAIAEPFVIDMSDPATHRDDWGGPNLAGVLAVHMLPGAHRCGSVRVGRGASAFARLGGMTGTTAQSSSHGAVSSILA